jgi:NAD(P)-dependent dehydrogenase (short-subunit alcohol dehydrogenase family)
MAEDELLAGRVAIVTGAVSGMGRVMARALASAGAKIAGVDIDASAALPVAAGHGARSRKTIPLRNYCDVLAGMGEEGTC